MVLLVLVVAQNCNMQLTCQIYLGEGVWFFPFLNQAGHRYDEMHIPLFLMVLFPSWS